MEKKQIIATTLFLKDLLKKGISLTEEGGQLKVFARKGSSLSAEDRQAIRTNKQDLLTYLEQHRVTESADGDTKIAVTERTHGQLLPASPSQERMWYIHQSKGSIAYHLSEVLLLRGQPDADALEQSFREIINRHEVLRTVFIEINYQLYQQVQTRNNWKLERAVSAEYGNREMDVQADEFISRPFDLAADCMLRARLIHTGEGNYVLIVVLHHIAGDGWSVALLTQELSTIYNSITGGKPASLPAIPVQYADYSQWCVNNLEGKKMQDQLLYWENKLANLKPVEPYTDYRRNGVMQGRGQALTFTIEKELCASLRKLSAAENVSLFVTMLSSFNLLLHRYCGQNDLCTGMPVANRNNSQLESLIGYFSNTVLIRTQVEPTMRFSGLLQQVKQTTLEVMANQEIPFEKVMEKTGWQKAANHTPLFHSVFVWQNKQEVTRLQLNNTSVSRLPYTNKTSKFDLTLAVQESEDVLLCKMEFNTELYSTETIRRFTAHYTTLLISAALNPDEYADRLNILSPAEKRDIFSAALAAPGKYPRTLTITDVITEQSQKRPDAIALTFNCEQLSYRELECRANRLANYLVKSGVRPGDLVPVCIDRSIDLIIAVLAVLKAGAAYVPIDPSYPAERIAYILADTGGRHILTTSAYSPVFGFADGAAIICTDKIWGELIASYPVSSPDVNIQPDNLAYVIYTSGSTGQPKGVMIEHRNVISLLLPEKQLYDFNERDVWTLFHSLSFDFSVWELFGSLFFGGRLVIISREETRDFELFARRILSEGVTVLNQTPGAFYLLQTVLLQQQAPLQLRYVIFGGEALNPALLRTWNSTYPTCRLINMYGITETTVHVSYKEITEADITAGISNIGVTLPTLSCLVLDKHQQLVSVGVPGELYILGEGLARGYLNREALTKERFIEHRFDHSTIRRMYRTGDMARRLADGNLEYLGRMDDQVKIRGYRIETGEIEHFIAAFPGVEQTIVQVKENAIQEKHLVAYIAGSDKLNREDILHFLQQNIPAHMLPSFIMLMSSLPLTANGKINKLLLPDPWNDLTGAGSFTAPRDAVEEQIQTIWIDVLGRKQISITDNFFDIGGDSIKAIRVVSALRKLIDRTIGVADLYQYATIEELGVLLRSREEAAPDTGGQAAVLLAAWDELKHTVQANTLAGTVIEDVYPMTDIQRGMVFSSLAIPDEALYHDQFVFDWPYKELDHDRFCKSFSLLVQKHEILRTGFDLQGYNEEIQVLYRTVSVSIEREDMSRITREEQDEAIRQYLLEQRKTPFDFSVAPLWRWKIVELRGSAAKLIFQCHHSILDGWSIASLFTEMNTVYNSLGENPSFIPAPLPLSIKQAVLSDLLTKKANESGDFWKQELSGYKRTAIFDIQPVYETHISKYNFTKLQNLTEVCSRHGHSVRELFFAAYLFALNMLTDEGEVTTGIVTNRRPDTEGGDKLLGCFLNTLPVRFQFVQSSYSEYVSAVSVKLAELKQKEGNTLVDIAREAGLSFYGQNPFFDTLFNYINFHILESADGPSARINIHENGGKGPDSFDATNTFLNFTADLTFNELRLRYVLRRPFAARISLAVFDRFIQSFVEHYTADSARILCKADLLTPDIFSVLTNWGNSAIKFPETETIVSLFEKTAAGTPGSTALIFENEQLSYRELDERANRVANYLLSLGVCNEELIAISVKRSAECIIGILGILKAGAAFVPIDPGFPQQRIQYLLEDTGARIFITDEEIQLAPELSLALTGIKRDRETIMIYPATPCGRKVTADQLAYVIYTSGSTGKPKGVMIGHGSLTDHLFGMIEKSRLQDCKSFALIASLTADAGYSMLFSAFITGSLVHIIAEEKLMDGFLMRAYLQQHSIDCIKIVPSLWLSYADDDIFLIPVKCMVFGGEAFPLKIVDYLRGAGFSGRVYNHYGPTEATIGKLIYRVDLNETYNTVPMGRPFSNTCVYVVDSNGELCLPGVSGELWIGGKGIAKGYLKKPALTAERFIPNPFDQRDKYRLYRTGDIVQWNADGNLVFYGRRDDQVKINGQRIETGEIENILAQCPLVKQCFVCTRQKGERHILTAYVVPVNDGKREEMAAYLKYRLPEYMLPAAWVLLEALPLNQIGKIDRTALPEPGTADKEAVAYQAPRDVTDAVLVEIWEQLLKVKPIGIHDNFFERGGHSLLIIRVISHIRLKLSITVPVTSFFKFPTVASMSDYIQAVSVNENAWTDSEVSTIEI